MLNSSTTRRPGSRGIAFDVILILLIGLASEAGHFSRQQGSPKQSQARINGDSAQHVDGAEALLAPDQTPNFGFRKPGYTLILAGVALLTGDMSWAVVAVNYLLLGLLPLAAFGLGCNLCSRVAGWLAALLTVAQLQFVVRGGQIMSEASYTFFMTVGLLVFAVGLSRRSWGRWMLGAGLLLGYAWLIRAVGVAVIASALMLVWWCHRHNVRRVIGASLCLLLPVAAAFCVECTLNLTTGGKFKPSTGAFGVMLLTRARYFQGSPFPDSPTTDRMLELLPERSRDDAYLANKLDGCVARAHAIRDFGMDEWTFDALAARSGLETIIADPKAYARTSVEIFVRHLLRQTRGPPTSRIPSNRRKPIIAHQAARDFEASQDHWYAYWFLPHRSVEESLELVGRMREAAMQPAPFGRSGIWADLRYLGMLPLVNDALGVVRGVALLWPGFALIFCALLGLNRRTCALLAIAYLLDGLIIGAFGASDVSNKRYQFVWLATDMALVACLVAPAIQAAADYLARSWRASRQSPAMSDRVCETS